MPTWLSNGPAPSAATTNVASALLGQRGQRAVGDGDDPRARLGGRLDRGDDPALVAAEVDGDDDVARAPDRRGAGRVAASGPSTQLTRRPEQGEVVGEAGGRCRLRRVAGQHPDASCACRPAASTARSNVGAVDGVEGGGHVVGFHLRAARPTASDAGSPRMRSAAGRRRLAELVLHGGLQPHEAVVAELRREPHDRGPAGAARPPTSATVPKATASGSREHDLGHPALGRESGRRGGASMRWAQRPWNRRYSDLNSETEVHDARWQRSDSSTRPGPPRSSARSRRRPRPTSTRRSRRAAEAQRAWARRPVPGARRGHRRRRRRARRAQGRAGRARRREAGQDPRRGGRRRAGGHRHGALRRRAGPRRVGRDRAVRAAEQDGVDHPPARRRRRDDHAVELPGRHPVVEVLPGAARRQRHRAQAVRARAGVRRARSSTRCVEAGVPADLVQVVHGARRAGRRARRAPRRRRGVSFTGSVPTGRKVAAAAMETGPAARVASSSAARTRWSCSTTPTSTSSVDGALFGAFGTVGPALHLDLAAHRAPRRRRRAGRAASPSGPRRCVLGDPLEPDDRRRPGHRPPRRPSASSAMVEAAVDEGADGRDRRRRSSTVDGLRGRRVRRARRCSPACEPDHRIAREEVFGPVLVGDRGRRRSTRRSTS